jgi:hypothetical protein
MNFIERHKGFSILSFIFFNQSKLSWHVGHQGDTILYFDSPKKVFFGVNLTCGTNMIYSCHVSKNNRWVHADWTIGSSSLSNFIELNKGFSILSFVFKKFSPC